MPKKVQKPAGAVRRRRSSPEITLAPEVVRWARVYRRRTQSEVADWLECDVDRVNSIETSGSPVTVAEFELLAKKLKLPQATLASPSPPNAPDPPEDYRTIQGRDPRLSLPTLAMIGRVQALQQIAAELADVRDPNLPTHTIDSNPRVAADKERSRLSLSQDDQLSFGSSEVLFAEVRNRIEVQRIAVYVQPFPLDDCRGFSLWAADTPATVVVNRREHQYSARVFTLVHEYGHLLLRRPGISDESRSNRTEAWCNRFAASFLMPSNLVAQFFREAANHSYASVSSAARALGVSVQALALRLEELGLAPTGFFERVSGSQGKLTRKPGRGNYVTTQVFSLARTYQAQVMAAYDGGRLSVVDAARLLDLSPVHFRAVRQAIARARL
jgi:Zn-dependent peptidase ImmA (M78 family)